MDKEYFQIPFAAVASSSPPPPDEEETTTTTLRRPWQVTAGAFLTSEFDVRDAELLALWTSQEEKKPVSNERESRL